MRHDDSGPPCPCPILVLLRVCLSRSFMILARVLLATMLHVMYLEPLGGLYSIHLILRLCALG